jgi:hypothetical protein
MSTLPVSDDSYLYSKRCWLSEPFGNTTNVSSRINWLHDDSTWEWYASSPCHRTKWGAFKQRLLTYNFSLHLKLFVVVHVDGPPTGLLFIPQMIYDYGEPRWNNTDRGNRKNSDRTLSQCHFIHHKSHMDWAGREPVPPRWEASNHVN